MSDPVRSRLDHPRKVGARALHGQRDLNQVTGRGHRHEHGRQCRRGAARAGHVRSGVRQRGGRWCRRRYRRRDCRQPGAVRRLRLVDAEPSRHALWNVVIDDEQDQRFGRGFVASELHAAARLDDSLARSEVLSDAVGGRVERERPAHHEDLRCARVTVPPAVATRSEARLLDHDVPLIAARDGGGCHKGGAIDDGTGCAAGGGGEVGPVCARGCRGVGAEGTVRRCDVQVHHREDERHGALVSRELHAAADLERAPAGRSVGLHAAAVIEAEGSRLDKDDGATGMAVPAGVAARSDRDILDDTLPTGWLARRNRVERLPRQNGRRGAASGRRQHGRGGERPRNHGGKYGYPLHRVCASLRSLRAPDGSGTILRPVRKRSEFPGDLGAASPGQLGERIERGGIGQRAS